MNRYMIVSLTISLVCVAWSQFLMWSHAALTERQIILGHPWQSAAIGLLVVLAVASAAIGVRKMTDG
jgi:hypothetical protein